MEGKEVRFGIPASALFQTSTTLTSTGAVNSMHDSFTPFGGGMALFNILLGEVAPGGTGSGLYGMLVLAIVTVFVAGLMVGRTPEYLGKKIRPAEMKYAALYILATPAVMLVFSGIAMATPTARNSMNNTGPHGLTEVLYAFGSMANNNGSAFAGLNGNTARSWDGPRNGGRMDHRRQSGTGGHRGASWCCCACAARPRRRLPKTSSPTLCER